MPADGPVEGPKSGYTDREMRLIFERAGQLEGESGADRRFSLVELKEMGAQAGLDPTDVATAAAAVRSEPPRVGMLGAPTRYSAVGHARRPFNEAGVVDAVRRIRESTRFHGELRAVPGGMEWRIRHSLGLTIVDFSPKGSGTRVDVIVAGEDRAAVTVLGTGIAGLLVGIGTAVVAASALHAGVGAAVGTGAVAAVAAAWGSARLIWPRISRGIAHRTSSLAAIITEAIETAEVDPPPPGEP